MDYKQIIKDIKNKVYHPVYFLMGEETYFIDLISDYIEANVLDENEKEFNQTILYGKDVKANDIIGTAKRFPMMANHQVVIVKEAQNVRDLAGKEKGAEAFLHYIENPQTTTILVICYKYKSVDKRTALAKKLSKHAVLFESKKLYDNKIPEWVANYVKSKKFTIAPKATVLLAEYLGTDLSKVSNELDKLMINLAPQAEITLDLIQKNIGISKDYNPFELQNAIGSKDILKANQIIKYFNANKRSFPLVLTLSSLNGYFSKLLAYHLLSDKSRNNVVAALKVHPFFVSDYERSARNYSLGKIKRIFSYLRDYDLKSKGMGSVTASEGELLKELVFKIMH